MIRTTVIHSARFPESAFHLISIRSIKYQVAISDVLPSLVLATHGPPPTGAAWLNHPPHADKLRLLGRQVPPQLPHRDLDSTAAKVALRRIVLGMFFFVLGHPSCRQIEVHRKGPTTMETLDIQHLPSSSTKKSRGHTAHGLDDRSIKQKRLWARVARSHSKSWKTQQEWTQQRSRETIRLSRHSGKFAAVDPNSCGHCTPLPQRLDNDTNIA